MGDTTPPLRMPMDVALLIARGRELLTIDPARRVRPHLEPEAERP